MSKFISPLESSDILFYKVVFFDESTTQYNVVPLRNEEIWSSKGLRKDSPFIVVNPGDGFINIKQLKDIPVPANKHRTILPMPKFFEEGVREAGLNVRNQYLVTINEEEMGSQYNKELIYEHNRQPNEFKTAHTIKQARLIYGPLISRNGISEDGSGIAGIALEEDEIVRNLSNARNFNECFGAISANGQINALIDIMRNLGVSESIIKESVENMRRLDVPNIASTTTNSIAGDREHYSQSTVIFEGTNDELARQILGECVDLPDSHDNFSSVMVRENVAKIYQDLPAKILTHSGTVPNLTFS